MTTTAEKIKLKLEEKRKAKLLPKPATPKTPKAFTTTPFQDSAMLRARATKPTRVEPTVEPTAEPIARPTARPIAEPKRDYQEPGILGQVKEGALEGYYQARSAFGGALKAVGVKTGREGIEEYGTKVTDKWVQKLQDNPELAAPKDIGKWKDPRFYARGIGALIPSLGGALASGVAGASAGFAVGGPVGATVGGLGAAGAYSVALEGGSAYNEAIELGAKKEDAARVAGYVGAINGLLEATPIGKVLSKNPAGQALKKSLMRRITKEIIDQGLVEGSTEAMQEIVNNAFQKEFDENRHLYDGVLESGVFGAIGGAAMGGAFAPRKIAPTRQEEVQPEQARDITEPARVPEVPLAAQEFLKEKKAEGEALSIKIAENKKKIAEGKATKEIKEQTKILEKVKEKKEQIAKPVAKEVKPERKIEQAREVKKEVKKELPKRTEKQIQNIMKSANVKFEGRQETRGEDLIMFTDKKTGSTLTLKESQLTKAAVEEKLTESRKAFGIEQPVKVGDKITITKGPEKGETGIVKEISAKGFVDVDVPARAKKGATPIGTYRVNQVEPVAKPVTKKPVAKKPVAKKPAKVEKEVAKPKLSIREIAAKSREKQAEKRKLERKKIVKKEEKPKREEISKGIIQRVRDAKTKQEFKAALLIAKRQGKDSEFFRKMYQKEFDKATDTGDFTKSDVLFDFMENEQGFTRIQNIISPLKEIENLLNKSYQGLMKLAYEKTGANKMVASLKEALGKSKIVDVAGRAIVHEYKLPQWYKDLKRLSERKQIKGQIIAEEMMSFLSKGLTEDQKIQLHEAIINEGKHEDPNIANRAAVARELIDTYGDEFWKVGGISRQVYEKNKGHYLMRAYYSHDIAKRVANWAKKGGVSADLTRRKKRGLSKKIETKYVENYVKKGYENRGQLKTNPKYSIVWRDWTTEERQAWGEIINEPAYLVSKSLMQISSDAAILEFFKEISKQKGAAMKEQFADYKQLPDSEKYGALRHKWVDPNMYSDIMGIIEMKDYGKKVSEKMLSEWKKYKVVFNPSTHARNIMFNVILSDIAGLSPTRVDIYGSALMDVINQSDEYTEARKAGVFGGTYLGNELKDLLQKNYNLTIRKPNKDGTYDYNWKEQFGDNAIGMMQKLLSAYKGFSGKMGRIYEAEEHVNKMALYLYAKNDLEMNSADASVFAKKWGLNYSAVTPMVAKLSTKWWGAPFVRFKAVAAPRVVEGAVTRPFTMIKYYVLLKAIQEFSLKALEIDEEDLIEIKEKLFPDWMKHGLYVLAPFKKNGKYQFFDMTYIVPFVDEAKDPVGAVTNQLYQNPFFKVPAELIFNKSVFTGEDIWDSTINPGVFGWSQAAATHAYRSITPPLAPGNYSFNKIWDAAKEAYDVKTEKKPESEKELDVANALRDVIFGLKFRQLDLTEQQKWRIVERRKKYKELGYEISKVKRDTDKSLSAQRKEIQRLRNLQFKIAEELTEITNVNTELFE